MPKMLVTVGKTLVWKIIGSWKFVRKRQRGKTRVTFFYDFLHTGFSRLQLQKCVLQGFSKLFSRLLWCVQWSCFDCSSEETEPFKRHAIFDMYFGLNTRFTPMLPRARSIQQNFVYDKVKDEVEYKRNLASWSANIALHDPEKSSVEFICGFKIKSQKISIPFEINANCMSFFRILRS